MGNAPTTSNNSPEVLADFEKGREAFEKGSYDEALATFIRCASASHGPSNYYMGIIYLNGKGVPVNPRESFRYFVAGRALSDGKCSVALGKLYLTKEYRNDALALECFNEGAERKEIEGKYMIGMMIMENRDIPERDDKKLALKYFTECADTGIVEGAYMAGCLRMKNEYDEKELGVGLEYLMQAAEGGHAIAAYELGAYYARKLNREEMTRWLKAAIDRGSDDAAYEVAFQELRWPEKGKVVELEANLRMLKEGHAKKNRRATYCLGYLHHVLIIEMPAIPHDLKLAEQYYMEAGEMGCAQSLLALGEFIEKDADKKCEYIQRAASLSGMYISRAMYSLIVRKPVDIRKLAELTLKGVEFGVPSFLLGVSNGVDLVDPKEKTAYFTLVVKDLYRYYWSGRISESRFNDGKKIIPDDILHELLMEYIRKENAK